jgi:threonyl-tRNA synthetase
LKIPFIITIGKNEYKNKTINVRRKDEIKEVNINDFLKEVMDCQK